MLRHPDPIRLPRLSDLGARHLELEVEVIETSTDAVRTILRNGTAELALTYDLALGAGVDAEYLGVAAPTWRCRLNIGWRNGNPSG